MGVEISLPSAPVHVTPGDSAPCVVVVRNAGGATRVHLRASGRGGNWLSFPADVIDLEPGESRQLTGRLRPPETAGPTGSLIPVTVTAQSDDGSARSSAATVVVLVAGEAVSAAFTQPTGALVRRGGLSVVFRSDGSQQVVVELTASADHGATCSATPNRVPLEPGGVAEANLVVIAPPVWWTARARTITVRLGWRVDGGQEQTVTAALVQHAVLRDSVLVTIVASLVLGILAFLIVQRTLG